MQIQNCIDRRIESLSTFPKVRPLPTRGIKLYQSESDSDTESILEYYQGPNHLLMEGFETLPFTFVVQRDGTISQWNEVAWQSTPICGEPFIAVLVVGCFTVDGSDTVLGTATNTLTQQQKESITYLKGFIDSYFKAQLKIYADSISGLELHSLCREINS